MAKKDLVAIWRARLKMAEECRKAFSDITERTEASYAGKLRPDHATWAPGEPWVCVEKVHSAIRAALPTLLYNRPRWSVQPTKPILMKNPETGEDEDVSWAMARSKELWLQHQWDKTCGNEHVRTSIVAAYLAFGSIKVGYIPIHEDSEDRGEFATDDDGNLIVGPDGLPELAKGSYLKNDDGEIIFDEEGMPILDPGPIIKEEFFAEYCHYDNLLFDPEGSNVFETTHSWVSEEWIRPLEEVRADSRYKKSVREKVQATRRLGDQPEIDKNVGLTIKAAQKDHAPGIDDDFARVRGFDIYDFKTGRYLVLVEETTGQNKATNDKFLMDVALPGCLRRGPYKFLKFNEVPGKWYPKPDAEGMAKLELEYNITRSQGMLQRRNSRPRFLEAKGMGFVGENGGEVERDKFLNGNSHSISIVNKTDAVKAADMPQIDATHYQALPLISADFNDVAGQPGAQRGIADADTATEASILAQSSDIRNNDRRDNQVQAFLGKIGKQMLELGAKYATVSSWIPVARPGDPPPFDFVEIKPEYLQGEFDVTVEVGSTQPRNSAARVAMMERVITALSQNPLIMASPSLMRRLFESLDIQDEQLFSEIQQIGEMMLQAQSSPTGGGAGGEQVLADTIASAAGAMPSSGAGFGTGGRLN